MSLYFNHIFLICSSGLIHIYQAGNIKISLNLKLQSHNKTEIKDIKKIGTIKNIL